VAAGSPWINPGTFVYPLKQRWFATSTQFSNEPTYVDGGDKPDRKKIYYHNDLDFGGCEGLTEVVAATDGLVVSVSEKTLPGYSLTPVSPRYDVVYLLDERGWYYRYSHLHTIDPAITMGSRVKMGQRIGILGKEGASGGWTHLHFGIKSRQPSGKWGTEEAYAFAWEAYQRENKPAVIAVARPHHFIRAGETITLDASKSWAASGTIKSHDWTFTDGKTASGAKIERTYSKPGAYSEILKVTDDAGNVSYDFAIVQVIGSDEKNLPPTIHPTFWPTTGLKPGTRDHLQSPHLPHHRRRDLGLRRWHAESQREVRWQCQSPRQRRLCDHAACLRKSGRLPRECRAHERAHPGERAVGHPVGAASSASKPPDRGHIASTILRVALPHQINVFARN
jgi:murein DD-endopeptidase MepM/ murein hydrolase activator NlpD